VHRLDLSQLQQTAGSRSDAITSSETRLDQLRRLSIVVEVPSQSADLPQYGSSSSVPLNASKLAIPRPFDATFQSRCTRRYDHVPMGSRDVVHAPVVDSSFRALCPGSPEFLRPVQNRLAIASSSGTIRATARVQAAAPLERSTDLPPLNIRPCSAGSNGTTV
jgi:hypothetical protein